MIRLLEKYSTGKSVLILFLLANASFLFMMLVTIPEVMSYAGSMKILDMMPGGYSWDYVIELFNTLGEEGRSVYLSRQLTADLFYPGLFMISYSTMIAYFLLKIGSGNRKLFYLAFIPLLAGLFDYFENFGIMNMLHSFPEISPESVSITNFFSVSKAVCSTITFVSLVILLLTFTIGKFFRLK
jgi:hypothetical protein